MNEAQIKFLALLEEFEQANEREIKKHEALMELLERLKLLGTYQDGDGI